MDLINELAGVISDKEGGIFVFGYYLPKDEYIATRIIDDVLDKVTKPISRENIRINIKYPNSTNRRINFDVTTSNSIMVVGMDDIVNPIIADKEKDKPYFDFSRKSFDEFRTIMNKRKNSIIIKSQLYQQSGPKPTFYIKNGSSIIFSVSYYCNICDGRFVVSKNRYGNSNRDYTSSITPYIRETKLDILLS